MSSSAFRARVARRTPFSICGLALLFLVLNPSVQRTEAKGTSLFYRRGVEDAALHRSDDGVANYKRSQIVKETEINCIKFTYTSEVHVVCGSETFYEAEAKDQPGSALFFRDLFLCIFLVLMAGTPIQLLLSNLPIPPHARAPESGRASFSSPPAF